MIVRVRARKRPFHRVPRQAVPPPRLSQIFLIVHPQKLTVDTRPIQPDGGRNNHQSDSNQPCPADSHGNESNHTSHPHAIENTTREGSVSTTTRRKWYVLAAQASGTYWPACSRASAFRAAVRSGRSLSACSYCADRLRQPADLHQRIPQIVVRLGEIGLDPQCLLVLCDGFLRSCPILRQSDPQIVVRLGEIGLDPQRLLVSGRWLPAILPVCAKAIPRL